MSVNDVQEAVVQWFCKQLQELFTDGIHQLVHQQTPVEIDDFL
jgi:hypothetical protein